MADPPAPWWCPPTLDRVWAAIAGRLEQTALAPAGRVTVGDLSRSEQRALSDLMGRAVLAERARIDLPLLDERLRARAGTTLLAAAEHVTGRTLLDRSAVRAERSARREAPVAVAQAWADRHPEVPRSAIEDWAGGLARDGLLARDRDPVALVGDALRVLDDRGGHGPARPPIARTELAARLRGDAHALDDGRRLSAVILRLIRQLDDAALSDGEAPVDSRMLWERLGVVPDRVSSTCLVLGLTPAHDLRSAGRLARLGPHEPTHLTWRDLDTGLAFAGGQRILVCENPRVLEAAAELEIDGWGVVCTSGRPALVTQEVLRRLGAAGTTLRYHGDFDWAGLAMTNDLVERFAVEPWRMTACDYLDCEAQLELNGRRVEAMWDEELAPAMEHRGLAVHEEATLPELLADL